MEMVIIELKKVDFQLWYINDEFNEVFRRTTVSPNYMVSNKGRKLSMGSNKRNPSRFKPMILGDYPNAYDRSQIDMSINGKRVQRYVSREVLIAFNPVFNMENLQCNHIDGNVTNNTYSDDYTNNLEWLTPSENTQHAFDNGLNQSKLTTLEQKKKIVKLHHEGLGYGKISKKLDIHASVVSQTVQAYKKKQDKVEITKNK